MAATTISREPLPRAWAFWSPSSDELIEAALDLAEVGQGTRLLDLGCGDGRVLVAAAERGADVRGIEINPGLARVSRRALEDKGLAGRVDEQDISQANLDADVIFAYLTPATLSRLAPRLLLQPSGTRLVMPRYGLTGWAETAFADNCYRYDLPLGPRPSVGGSGWPFRAMIACLPPLSRCLVPLKFAALPGSITAELGPTFRRIGHVRVGADHAVERELVAVDVQVGPCEVGSAVAGTITVQGAELQLAVVFSTQERGQWVFTADQGEDFRGSLTEKVKRARSGPS